MQKQTLLDHKAARILESKDDISETALVIEVTLRNAYKKLVEELKIVPNFKGAD